MVFDFFYVILYIYKFDKRVILSMNTVTSYNLDFLNNYFTSNEFAFINNANLENQKLDEIVSKETRTRDIIVNFINNLHNSISDIHNDETHSDFLALLSEVQEIFERINNNISVIQDLKQDSSHILNEIVELLIQIEEHPDNQEIYSNKVQNLKNEINTFSVKNEDVRSKILLNDIKIDTFFQKNIVKKYLASFDTEMKLNHYKNVVDETTPSENEYLSVNTDIPSSDNTSEADTDSLSNSTKSTVANISENFEENHTLRVSEKSKKVFLPYTKQEIALYLEQYPDSYTSFEDVVNKEFVLSLDYYMKHPVVARFREAYSLIRDRESKSVVDAFKFAIDMMFRYELNPVIIAGCKTQEQLEHYLSCLEKNSLDDFTDFNIKFEVSPLA